MEWTKLQTAQFLGWSEKTLERKTTTGKTDAAGRAVLTGFGVMIGRRGGKGTGSHVMFDEQKVRIFKAKADSEQIASVEDVELNDADKNVEIYEQEKSDNSDTPEISKTKNSEKVDKTGVSETQKSDIALETFAKIMILPQKMAYNLKEANMISGIPQSFIKSYAQDTVIGYMITRERLEKCRDDFFKQKYVRPMPANRQLPAKNSTPKKAGSKKK